MGVGIVGGRMPNYKAMGRQAGVAVSRLLNGDQKKERIFPGKKLVTREPSTGRTCNGSMASKQDHVVHF